MHGPEQRIVSAILTYLNGLPHCHAKKTHGGPLSAGEPDILACLKGRMLQLEVKAPWGEATTRQLLALRDWARAGAVSAVVYSVEDVKQLLEKEGLL